MNDQNELNHSGTPGMRWGVRRYRNYDGTLTPAGKERYYKLVDKHSSKIKKNVDRADASVKSIQKTKNKLDKVISKHIKEVDKNREDRASKSLATANDLAEETMSKTIKGRKAIGRAEKAIDKSEKFIIRANNQFSLRGGEKKAADKLISDIGIARLRLSSIKSQNDSVNLGRMIVYELNERHF